MSSLQNVSDMKFFFQTIISVNNNTHQRQWAATCETIFCYVHKGRFQHHSISLRWWWGCIHQWYMWHYNAFSKFHSHKYFYVVRFLIPGNTSQLKYSPSLHRTTWQDGRWMPTELMLLKQTRYKAILSYGRHCGEKLYYACLRLNSCTNECV